MKCTITISEEEPPKIGKAYIKINSNSNKRSYKILSFPGVCSKITKTIPKPKFIQLRLINTP